MICDKNIQLDEWIATIENKKIVLYHINKSNNRTNKMKYHLQRKFEKDERNSMLRYISNHNRRSINNRHNRHEKIDKILKDYNNS